MGSTFSLECVYRLALAEERIIQVLESPGAHQKSMHWKLQLRSWSRTVNAVLVRCRKVSRLHHSIFGISLTMVSTGRVVRVIWNALLMKPEFLEIYDHSITAMNSYRGGVFQQAVSGLTNLNNDWYDGKQYAKYAFEYKTGKDGYITWYVGDDKTWTMDARAMGPNGNIGRRTIPEEPLSIVANFGMSNSFAYINIDGISKLLPATMRIDYIRIYQDEGNEIMTCDPPGYPTTEYIRKHQKPYYNPNLTHW